MRVANEMLKNPSPEVVKQLDALMPAVIVGANQPASIDIRLERGAAISGNVTYDDGSPASALDVDLLRKQPDGSWKSFHPDSGPRSGLNVDEITDDRGGFRESTLPAGEYILEASLPIGTKSAPGQLEISKLRFYTNPQGAVRIFSGNVTRLKLATPITVTAGEEHNGADITIPLSGLHQIHGSVAAIGDHHAIPHGTVELIDPDDSTAVLTEPLDQDGTFDFDAVPEGDYIVRVSGASDGEEGQPTRQYKSAQQPLSVHSDVNDVSLTVSSLKASSPAAQ
ncbi:MAG TPA: hypothetical protein VE291_10935 [Terracidiphilus sp.]|nr:hypothetical protein [Terracidiphilus sp.]